MGYQVYASNLELRNKNLVNVWGAINTLTPKQAKEIFNQAVDSKQYDIVSIDQTHNKNRADNTTIKEWSKGGNL